jgi:hypothetical protein
MVDTVAISHEVAEALEFQRKQQNARAKQIGQDIEYYRILAQENIQLARDHNGRVF